MKKIPSVISCIHQSRFWDSLVTKSQLRGSAYFSKTGLPLQVTYGGTAFLYFPRIGGF
jgi:hypothetical protein